MDKSVKDKLTKEAYELLKLPTIEFYYGPLEFFDENNIDENQEGFRYNANTGEIIEEWTGDEYVIVGFDYSAGCGPDPFIVKTDEKELPVFWLMTDGGDWKNPDKIANSLDDFIKIKSKYNEQKCIKSDTVFRHFSTTFKLFPFKTQSIKPWHIDKLHEVLNTYELDDILDKYLELKGKVV